MPAWIAPGAADKLTRGASGPTAALLKLTLRVVDQRAMKHSHV